MSSMFENEAVIEAQKETIRRLEAQKAILRLACQKVVDEAENMEGAMPLVRTCEAALDATQDAFGRGQRSKEF